MEAEANEIRQPPPAEAPMVDWALWWTSRGVAVFPLQPKSKEPIPGSGGFLDATTDPEKIRTWWAENPSYNLAGRPPSGGFVLDVDADKRGFASLEGIVAAHPEIKAWIEASLRVHTGGRDSRGAAGVHVWGLAPVTQHPLTQGKITQGLDYRAQSGYLVLPPSIHPNGNRYELFANATAPFTVAPASLLDPIRAEHQTAKLPPKVSQGQRSALLATEAYRQAWDGKTLPEILAILHAMNAARCTPPKRAEKIEELAHRALRNVTERQPPVPGEDGVAPMLPDGWRMTHTGDAHRLLALHREDLRWISDEETWIVWNGEIWQRIDDFQAMQYAAEVGDFVRNQLGKTDKKLIPRLLRWAEGIGNVDRAKRALDVAKGLPDFRILFADLDRDPDLAAFKNGVFDFRTGELREPRAEDYITRRIPHAYNKEAKCTEFMKQLETYWGSDKDIINTYQQWAGYCLTGRIDERKSMLRFGVPRAGKTVLKEVERLVYGSELSGVVEKECFIRTKYYHNPLSLVQSRGCTTIFVDETGQEDKLNIETWKAWTGGDQRTLRALYEMPITFMPKGKAIFSTNYRLLVYDADEGVWDRWIVLPFQRRFTDEEVSKHPMSQIIQTLSGEAEGILAWWVQGELDRRKQSLISHPPESIAKALADYQKEMDPLGAWTEERLEFGKDLRARGGALKADADVFMRDNNYPRITSRRIAQFLIAHGLKSPTDGKRTWAGIGLRDDAQEQLLPDTGARRHEPRKNGLCARCGGFAPIDDQFQCAVCWDETLGGTKHG